MQPPPLHQHDSPNPPAQQQMDHNHSPSVPAPLQPARNFFVYPTPSWAGQSRQFCPSALPPTLNVPRSRDHRRAGVDALQHSVPIATDPQHVSAEQAPPPGFMASRDYRALEVDNRIPHIGVGESARSPVDVPGSNDAGSSSGMRRKASQPRHQQQTQQQKANTSRTESHKRSRAPTQQSLLPLHSRDLLAPRQGNISPRSPTKYRALNPSSAQKPKGPRELPSMTTTKSTSARRPVTAAVESDDGLPSNLRQLPPARDQSSIIRRQRSSSERSDEDELYMFRGMANGGLSSKQSRVDDKSQHVNLVWVPDAAVPLKGIFASGLSGKRPQGSGRKIPWKPKAGGMPRIITEGQDKIQIREVAALKAVQIDSTSFGELHRSRSLHVILEGARPLSFADSGYYTGDGSVASGSSTPNRPPSWSQQSFGCWKEQAGHNPAKEYPIVVVKFPAKRASDFSGEQTLRRVPAGLEMTLKTEEQ